MKLSYFLLLAYSIILLPSSAAAKTVTKYRTDKTVTTTKIVTESLLVVTVHDSSSYTTILRRKSANQDATSSYSTSTSSIENDSSTQSEATSTSTNLSSEVEPTEAVATILSSASTYTSTLFSSALPSSFKPETGTIISTVSTTSQSSASVETQSSSLRTAINASTLTNDVTIALESASSLSSLSSLSGESTADTSGNSLSTGVVSTSTSISSSSSSSSFQTLRTTSTSSGESTSLSSTSHSSSSNSASNLIHSTYTSRFSSTENTSSAIESSSLGMSSASSLFITTSGATSSTESSTKTSDSSSSSTINLFEAISTDSPPSVFSREELDYSIASGVDNGDTPYQTNKFFSNLILDEQSNPAFTFPYSFFYVASSYYGIAISHTTSSYFGDDNGNGAASYYSNSILVGSLIFSASSFTSDKIEIEVTDMKSMSALVTLTDGSDDNYIDIPLVEGMGFGSAIYNGALIPEINSQVGIESMVAETSSALADGILKYRVSLANSVDWLIYVTLPSGASTDDFELSVDSYNSIIGSSAIDGLIIQFSIAPDESDSYYDEAAGMYPLSCEVQGSYVEGSSDASYEFAYNTEGASASGNTIVFALPHHIDSLTDDTKNTGTGITLYSPTKGTMYAFLTNTLSLSETLNLNVSYLPYAEIMKDSLSYTSDQLKLIAEVANSELSVDISSLLSSETSMYTAGKVLDKYAYILLTVSEIIGDDGVTNSTLESMKRAFDDFINNTEYYPLIYDTKFGGVTSSAGQGGDTDADYGSSHYNDHHFHYGYFLHAAAVVGYIDKKNGGTWASDNQNWVNSLIRDVINPSTDDTYYPVSRMFDWFHGHSWASGLTDSGDGLNQESSSEDYNCYYGMKLWGSVIGDKSMEYRGDLILSIMKKSINSYYLFQADNSMEPSEYIGNKVAGILFQNKLAYTTYFGTNTEYIHGIHMLPITPASGLIRVSNFVKEEWDSIISDIIDDVDSGWTSILRINQALSDPSSSYDFYSSDSWDDTHLDNGQSRTWGLAFSAGLLNSS